MSVEYVPDSADEWLGGRVTLRINYHSPEPAIIETAKVNEWASAYLSTLYVHVWDAMKYGSAQQAVLAFQLQVQRLNDEWAGP